MNKNSVQLQTNTILNVPIQNYEQTFTFIVNNEEFHTSFIVADLLSPKISRLHLIDPTINEYRINTNTRGDFNKIIELVKFENTEIKDDELSFFIEIIEHLENTPGTIKFNRINIKKLVEEENDQSTLELLEEHQKYPTFYSSEISAEIDQISREFYSMKEEEKRKFQNLNFDIIERIINNSKLRVNNEDELVEMINKLYEKSHQYSELYSYVLFENVSSNEMKEFISKIKFEDVNEETWKSISARLCAEIKEENTEHNERYKIQNQKQHQNQHQNSFKKISFNNQNFDGIINFLRQTSNIKEEISISCSSRYANSRDPWDVILYEQNEKVFCTKQEKNEWLCIEFKKHKIKPTNYTIKSGDDSDNIKSFVIEVSNDNQNWEIIDEQNNCSSLKQQYSVKAFAIQNEKQLECKYVRIRETGKNWANGNCLQFSRIEFYGEIL